MSGAARVLAAVLAASAAGLLSGCAYDYLQHTDRVAYSAGDAVKANLEQETTNPSKHSMYVKSGLGADGNVIPSSSSSSSSSSAASTSGSGTSTVSN